MSVFVTITANLIKNKDGYFETFSENDYILSGVASPDAKILYVDDEIVQISPFTYTWTKKVKAKKTGAKTIISHVVKAFGHGNDAHQISGTSNSINVLILPPC